MLLLELAIYTVTSYPELATLFLESHGSSSQIDQQVEIVEDIIKSNEGNLIQWAKAEEDRTKLWKARHNLFYASLALRPGSKAVITDVCVPITKLPESIIHAQKCIDSAGLIGPILGHVGDGNFHAIILCNLDDGKELEKAKSVALQLGKKSLILGGTCTGEHGIGQGKKALLEEEMGTETIAAMTAVKRAFDPYLLMNPGKVLSM